MPKGNPRQAGSVWGTRTWEQRQSRVGSCTHGKSAGLNCMRGTEIGQNVNLLICKDHSTLNSVTWRLYFRHTFFFFLQLYLRYDLHTIHNSHTVIVWMVTLKNFSKFPELGNHKPGFKTLGSCPPNSLVWICTHSPPPFADPEHHWFALSPKCFLF